MPHTSDASSDEGTQKKQKRVGWAKVALTVPCRHTGPTKRRIHGELPSHSNGQSFGLSRFLKEAWHPCTAVEFGFWWLQVIVFFLLHFFAFIPYLYHIFAHLLIFCLVAPPFPVFLQLMGHPPAAKALCRYPAPPPLDMRES